MNVSMMTNSLHTQRYSRTGSIGGISLPDFEADYVYTKKHSSVSEQEYKKKIVEQAYKDYANGKFQNDSKEFVSLMKQYTSEVSPDREGIIKSGLKAVSKDNQKVLQPIDVVLTILEGEVRYQKAPSGSNEYIEFYDSNGEMVATHSNNGWTMYTTNAECARQTQMCTIYNEAWANAKKGVELSVNEATSMDNGYSTFEAFA